jgi:hypothetical protein
MQPHRSRLLASLDSLDRRFVSKWLLQIFSIAAACMHLANGISELQSIRQPTEGRQAIGTGSANGTRRLNGGSFEPIV